jgi:hypothetical protein
MKRVFIIAMLTISLASLAVASDFSVSVNISSNWGVSDFFQQSQSALVQDGVNYLESVENRLGFGYSFSLNIPVMERLYVVPSLGQIRGHQQYLLENVDDPDDDPEQATSYFKITSFELAVLYDLFVLENGWTLDLRCGLNRNKFVADEEMGIENKNYWGLQLGVGAKFLHLKHWGFQLLGLYKVPFDSELYAFFSAQFGVIYKF